MSHLEAPLVATGGALSSSSASLLAIGSILTVIERNQCIECVTYIDCLTPDVVLSVYMDLQI